MKKAALSAVALVLVSAVSFWFGQRHGLEDFSRCVERGGLPVDSDYGDLAVLAAPEIKADEIVGDWRFSAGEMLTRSFLPDGTYQDSYGGERIDESGEWKISGKNLVLLDGEEQQIFVLSAAPGGESALLPVGGLPSEGFVR